mgnify:CR=1 FL=1
MADYIVEMRHITKRFPGIVANKDVTIQISDAKKQAEILEAEGEQEYMKILAQAYGEEERSEFYSFVRSLDALKASMKGGNKTIILSSDSPIAQIFEGK